MAVPIFSGQLMKHVSMARFNSWRVGGKAKQLYKPTNLQDLQIFLKTLAAADEPLWLGLGSNVLIRDGGLDNTVIITQGSIAKLEMLEADTFRAEAGVTCAKAARFCVKHDFANAEFFAGIPGTVGGALAMNAGAFGHETWQYVAAVETIDKQGNIRQHAAKKYTIGYRSVVGPKEWFVAAYFKLPKGDGEVTAARIKKLLKERSASQPIGQLSCGSVFTNPVNDYAARLIEVSGLKGYRIGGATVSTKHANFIINKGDATARDIEKLILTIQQTVLQQQSIKLVPEVRIFGKE